MQKLKGFFDSWGWVLKWGPLLIGGGCLLANSAITGRFPEDIDLGEGAALYFISMGFLAVYPTYWIGLTCVGLVILRWPMKWLSYFGKYSPSHAAAYLKADFSVMWSLPVWVIAVLTVIVVALFLKQPQPLLDFRLHVMVVLQGFLGGTLIMIQRRLKFESSGVLMGKKGAEQMTSEQHRNLRIGGATIAFLWIVMPFVFAPVQGSFVNTAFRLAQLSKSHATVHVRSPWDQRLSVEGLRKEQSFLGDSYGRFDDVNVRLMSLGSRVVLELSNRDEGAEPKYLAIPRESIEVE